MLRDYLDKIYFINVVGVANTDAQEIILIEKLNPDIVITDIVRNEKFSGIDIIKTYKAEGKKIKFLILSDDYYNESIRKSGVYELIDGHLSKVSSSFERIVEELKRISKL